MAESLDDGEFWLPSHFLADDDAFMGSEICGRESVHAKPMSHFKCLNDASSPLNCFGGLPSSVIDGERCEGECDLVETLTQKLSESNFHYSPHVGSKGRLCYRSPLSTLCSLGKVCRCQHASAKGMYAVIDDLVPLGEEATRCNENSKLDEERRLGYALREANSIAHQNQNLLFNLQAMQHVRQQRILHDLEGIWKQDNISNQHHRVPSVKNSPFHGSKALRHSAVPSNDFRSTRSGDLFQSNIHRPHHGEMAPVLPTACLPKKKPCAGTGVFLPRRTTSTATPTETRKSSGCPNILLPARVVQALNLNLDDFGDYTQLFPNVKADVGRYAGADHIGEEVRKRVFRPHLAKINGDVGLPQEWTY